MPLIPVEALLTVARPGRPVIADGAVGTELMARGVSPDQLIGANISASKLVSSVHRDYLDAGAQLITSNTFCVASDSAALGGTLAGIGIAIEAASRHSAGSAVYISLSPVIEDRALDACLACISFDLRPFVVFALETCTSLPATLRRIERIRNQHAGVIAATCVFDRHLRTRDGVAVADAAHALLSAGAGMIGANCCDEECNLPELTACMKQAGARWIVMRPNAGLPVISGGKPLSYPVDRDQFVRLQCKTTQLGATVAGGCCGTTPNYIHALRNMFERDRAA